MKRTTVVLFATASVIAATAALVAPRTGSAQNAPVAGNAIGLSTDLVRFAHPVTQAECMTRASAALTAGGFSDVHTDPTAAQGRRPWMTAQVECLNGRGTNAAYITVGYMTPQAEFRAHHDPLLQAMGQ